MNFLHRLIRNLVLPSNRGPNDPGRVLGPDVPPELLAWATANTVTLYTVDIFYFDATHYEFSALGLMFGQVRFFVGSYDPVNTVVIWQTLIFQGGAGVNSLSWSFGDSLFNTFRTWYTFTNSKFNVQSSTFDLNLFTAGSDFIINNTSQPRGLIAEASSTAGIALVGAETVMLTTQSESYASGRCFEIRFLGNWSASVAGNQGIVRLRKTGGGTIAAEVRTDPLPVTGSFATDTICAQFQVAVTANIVFDETLQSTAGTVNDSANALGTARRIQIWDIGAVTDFTNVRSI